MDRLTLIRDTFTDKSTTGELYVDGVFECFTLEDPRREGPKVLGATCIPEGAYRLDITFSPRFQKDMPILWDVPGFTGVRIHTGNNADDTEGCILVGSSRLTDSLAGSRMTYDALLLKLKGNVPCSINVTSAGH